jgi:hypothetical protein
MPRSDYNSPRPAHRPPQVKVSQPHSHEQEPIPAHRPAHSFSPPIIAKKRHFRRVAILLLIFLIAAGGIFYKFQDKPAKTAAAITPTLPASVINGVNYPVYYPVSSANGYKYEDGSAKMANSLVWFRIFKGSHKIAFGETAQPASGFSLDSLTGYSKVDLGSAQAAVGGSPGQAAAVVLTGRTLISVSGTREVTQDEIISVLRTLKPLSATNKSS